MAQSYVQHYAVVPAENLAQRADLVEKIALYRYLAALQAQSRGEFLRNIKGALYDQRRATALFEQDGKASRARLFRSQALENFLAFWLSGSLQDRKSLLEKSWRLTIRALRAFHAARDFQEYAESYIRLSFVVGLSIEHDGSLGSRVRKNREAVEHGKRTVAILRGIGDKTDLAKALIRVSIFLDGLADELSDKIKQRDYRRESLESWEEGMRVSRNIALYELSHPLHGFPVPDPGLNLKVCEEALGIVTLRKDNFALGRLMDYMAKWTFYAAESSTGGDPAVASKMHVKALHYAEEAAKHYDIVNFTSAIGGVMWVHSPYTEHFNSLAKYEIDPTRRTLLEEKALQSAPELLRLAKRKGSPRVLFYALHTSSKVELNVAGKEKDRNRQKRLLQKALSHRIQIGRVANQIFASTSWNRLVGIRWLSDGQSQLASLERNRQKKTGLLVDAIRNQEKSLRLALSFVRMLEPSGPNFYTEEIARFYAAYGDLLSRLESTTENERFARKAARAYSTAADWYERIPRYDRSAECHWKSAETYNRLGVHSVASECYTLASEAYIKLGGRVPSLKELSRDYAAYLGAWAQIEMARSLHLRQEFDSASESYRQAAQLHRDTKRWNLLAPYYQAWSKLESGENFNRSGHYREAVEAFREAATEFTKSKTSIKDRLPQNGRPEERLMLEKIANSTRDSYCTARINLEEAMMAEAQEDYQKSFEEFGLASEKFGEISTLSESEEDNREAAFLSALCKAWQLASKAELQDSIEPLLRAVSLFERARTLSPNEKSLKLASGHRAFCEGLIASRKFADTLDAAFHEEASRQLELASRYYFDTGFKTAGYHARARRLLLNAYFLLNNTKDQGKRTEAYALADTLLRQSSIEFLRARQPIKRKQAQRLLEETRLGSRISSHLTDTLKAVAYPSSNAAIYTSAQGVERAIGLERFDHADIEVTVGNVTTGVRSGGEAEFEIEISNIGKQPIRLLRLDEVVPEGAELVGYPEAWRLRGRSLASDARLISPAKTEKLRLVVRPRGEGLLRIRPKIFFADDNGSNWERLADAKIIPTSRIIEFLASSFIRDNVGRLRLELCGWRSMMEIVKGLQIPRSHVYGEPRYGRTFGRQLDSLVKSSLVEYRVFPGERGRGGKITRLRIQPENEDVRKYIEELSSTNLPHIEGAQIASLPHLPLSQAQKT